MTLEDKVWALLNEALIVYRDSPRATGWLRNQLARFGEPVRIAVAGSQRIGKSTVVNALIGEEFTAGGGFTWYRDGVRARATAFTPSGPQEVPVVRRDGRPHVEIGMWDQVDRLIVDWPTRSLRDATIIDTPATATSDQVYREADAVLYLMRHLQDVDLRYLQAAHENPIARASPINTVVLLAKADEIGAGRIDALSSTKQIARRYRREARVEPLCQNVIAVAGLIAVAARTMKPDEFTALTALAALPRTELEDHLLSADRFVGNDFPVALTPSVRQGLLERYGIFGVRLTATLIRQGFDTQVKLVTQLVQRSGLGELRDSIAQYFTDRREVLKARSALLALEVVLRAEPKPAARKIVMDLERIVAGAHDVRELRLLAALQGGRTRLPSALEPEASRLVGGLGTAIQARLGLEYEADETEQRYLIADLLARWREQAANPVLDQDQRRAATVVVRSCEGMLSGLG
ncbi:GTPase domain-containing protein [Umezawaea sp. Da 62-37]|uniref:GTPase domain-containing protein n=1 Tax=Umezawaea sp. Da 62-37 TaxID=3075927 RepID=UPI0028F6DA2C|nr:GTPase domain-containing protein [Umezawaea sp. Da 62-37]WNV82118.1 GTPase domain-containing protein [Umezawaea sp. Da 62-37]